VKKHLVLMLGGLSVFGGCGGGSSAPPPPPVLNLAPASLSFGLSVVGTTNSQVETLTNTGGSDLAINSVAITGTNAADFDQNGTCGFSLSAGASCILSVTFRPSQLGQRIASITIADDAMVSSQVLSLTGVGGDSGPNATLSPTSLSFSNQSVGTMSPTQAVMLSNYGTATLSITAITASTNFGQTNTCNSTLASGANCTINVAFAPSQTGNSTGTLSVADNAPGTPHSVALNGATTKATLTGYCSGEVHHGAPDQCGTGQDFTECPVGAPAIAPTTVADACFPPAAGTLVDLSRTCSFRTYGGRSGTGYCVAQY
jgi:hypothetical protein